MILSITFGRDESHKAMTFTRSSSHFLNSDSQLLTRLVGQTTMARFTRGLPSSPCSRQVQRRAIDCRVFPSLHSTITSEMRKSARQGPHFAQVLKGTNLTMGEVSLFLFQVEEVHLSSDLPTNSIKLTPYHQPEYSHSTALSAHLASCTILVH